MNKKDFADFLKSVREMKKIKAGRQKPARVTKYSPLMIKKIRKKLQQSQWEFATMIGVSPSTLRNWEQGLRQPVGPACALLKVADKNPQAVLNALHP